MSRGYLSARSILTSAYHAGGALVDRMLHRGRHRRIRKRLDKMARPRSILVVCYGNICRSPYLEAVLRRKLPDVDVSSAGFVGAGRTVPEQSLIVARGRDIDLSTHRSKLIDHANMRGADVVIVMDAEQARRLRLTWRVPFDRIIVAGDLDPLPGQRREIRDPWRQPIEVFEASFDRLERCAETIVAAIPVA